MQGGGQRTDARATLDQLPVRLRPAINGSHLTESVYKVVLQKSIPTQIRQLIFYYY